MKMKLSYRLSFVIINLRLVCVNLTIEKKHSDTEYNPRTHEIILQNVLMLESTLRTDLLMVT